MSVGATLGVLVILYPSHGGTSGVAFFVPLFLFVLVFGLSVDYEVFLLSRLVEATPSGRLECNRRPVRPGAKCSCDHPLPA